jgi:hypothetical protein
MLQEFLITVISSVAVSSVFSGLLLWVTKLWISERLKNAIKSEYDQKLESHKSQLKAQNDIEVEKLKSSLNITAAEQGVMFSTLHRNRAEVIAETYALVRDAYNRVVEFSSHNTQENRERVEGSIKNLTDYYPKRRIFISYEVANKIDRLRVELSRIVEDINAADFDYDSTSMYNRIYEDTSEALSNLEEDFRVLLGEDLTRKSSGLVNSPLI